jgi:hypothetical protein
MQLSEALRLVRKVDPEAIMHRDHMQRISDARSCALSEDVEPDLCVAG